MICCSRRSLYRSAASCSRRSLSALSCSTALAFCWAPFWAFWSALLACLIVTLRWTSLGPQRRRVGFRIGLWVDLAASSLAWTGCWAGWAVPSAHLTAFLAGNRFRGLRRGGVASGELSERRAPFRGAGGGSGVGEGGVATAGFAVCLRGGISRAGVSNSFNFTRKYLLYYGCVLLSNYIY